MLKSSHRRTRKQARRPKLETLEKRQLFAGDIAGVTAAAADATIKSDLQAVYAAPVAKTSVIEQTGNKDGDVAMAADPRLSQAVDQIDSILAAVGAEGNSFDLGGVLSKLGSKSVDGHITPTSVSTVDSALDSLFGNKTETSSEGQTDPLGIFISTLVGQAGADLGSTGLPDFGGTATTTAGIETLVGKASNSLVSEYNGALSTVPDDSSPLPEHKHEDGNTSNETAVKGSNTSEGSTTSWSDNITNFFKGVAGALTMGYSDFVDGLDDPDVFMFLYRWGIVKNRDIGHLNENGSKQQDQIDWGAGASPDSNPDPTGDPTAFLSIADLVAFEQQMRDRAPADPVGPDEGGEADAARFTQTAELNRWNMINPSPEGEDGSNDSGGHGTTTPLPRTNPLGNPPEPESGGSNPAPKPLPPEPLPPIN